MQAIKIALGHSVAHFDMALSFYESHRCLDQGEELLFSANTYIFKVREITFPRVQLVPEGREPLLSYSLVMALNTVASTK